MKTMDDEIIFSLLNRVIYNSSEIYFNTEKNRNLLEIFIYASGKTASTSLFESFKALNKNSIHMHGTQYYLKYILKADLYEQFSMFDYINYLSKRKNNILVVDIVREPISRKISSFFQHLDRLPYVMQNFNSVENMQEYYLKNIDQLVDIFNTQFLLKKENYYGFDEYVADGVFIRKRKFSHIKKRMHFKHNNKKYLIIRFDDIPLWNEIFRDIGYTDFELTNVNKAESKNIATLYKAFKQNFMLTKQALDILYLKQHKKVLDIFYTPKEIASHYNKWLTHVK